MREGKKLRSRRRGWGSGTIFAVLGVVLECHRFFVDLLALSSARCCDEGPLCIKPIFFFLIVPHGGMWAAFLVG